MAVNQSISGVLMVDDKILNQLEKAEKRLTNLSKAADDLSKNMNDARKSMEAMAKVKMPSFNVNFGGFSNVSNAMTNINRQLAKIDFSGPFDKATKSVDDLAKRLEDVKQTTSDIKDLAEKLGAAFNGGNAGGGGNGGGTTVINNSASALRQMATALAGFSVIKSFGRMVSEAVSIRGEFEMAQRSLGFIIGDLAKSEEIFSRIKEQAVVSPFEVGDLVKQTRQLAAYGIETEKLSDTVRRLGDIASGVGVDMGRLILAYGQVKAAQFLRLTEVRQFTEAGVDVLGGLATYFTEIEHRAVSVGEVMTRITKKMVTFSDVEVVLNRLTSAGGKFYNMQEKQADTIQGTISNLKDRWNIELNDFMTTYDVFIKNILGMAQGLIGGMRVLAPIITTLFSGLAVGSATAAVHQLIKAFKSLFALTGGFSLIAGAVTAIVTGIALCVAEATRFKRALKDINENAEVETSSLISKYRRLTDTIKNAADGSEVQRKAMEELRSEYGNILPAIDLEANAIGNLTDKYEQHIEAIKQYTYAKAAQERTQKLITELNDSVLDNVKDFTWDDRFIYLRGFFEKQGVSATEGKEVLRSVYSTVVEELLDKKLLPNYVDVFDRVYTLISSYAGAGLDPELLNKTAVNTNIKEILELIAEYNEVAGPKIDLSVPKQYQQVTSLIDNMGDMVTRIRTILKDSGLFVDNAESLDLAVETILGTYRKALQANAKDPGVGINGFVQSLINATETAKGAIKGDPTSELFKKQVADIDWAALMKDNDSLLHFWDTVYYTLGQSANTTAFERVLYQKIDSALAQFSPTPLKERLTQIIADINNQFPALAIKLPTIQERQSLGDYAETVFTALEKVKKEEEILASARGDSTLKNVDILSRFGFSDNGDVAKAKAKMQDYKHALELLWNELYPFYEDKSAGSKRGRDSQVDYLTQLAEAVAAFPANSADKAGKEVAYLKKQMTDLAKSAGVAFNPDSVLADEASIKKWLASVDSRLASGKGEKLQYKVGITFDKQAVKELKEKATALFTDYQLALGFEKNGVSIPGMGTEETMGKILDIENELRNVYQDNTAASEVETRRLQIVKKNQEDIINLIAKHQVDVTKKSVGIIETAQKEIAQMSGVNAHSGETGISLGSQLLDTAVYNRVVKALQDVGHEQYELLRSGEMYVDSFNDLTDAPLKALTALRDMLTEVKGSFGLSPKDERRIEQQILKIDDRLGQMGNGKRHTLSYSFFNTYSNVGKEMKNLGGKRDAYISAIEARTEAQRKLNEITEKYRDMEGIKDGEQLSDNQMERLRSMEGYADAVQEVADATENADRATESYMNSINYVRNSMKTLKTQVGNLQSAFSTMTDLVSGSIDICESFAEGLGITFSDEHQEAVDAFLSGFELMSQGLTLVAGGVTMLNLLMDVLNIKADELLIKLWPLAIVAAAIGAAYAAIKIVDNKKKQQIEDNLDLVEELTEAYDKLVDAMESAESVTVLTRNFKEANKVLQESLEKLEEARDVEYNRGAKRDDEELKDIQDKISDTYNQIKEAQEEFYDALSVPTDWSSEAEDWADAWLDAFKEGESGVEALRESMDDLLDDIIAKQIKLRVVGPLLADFEKAVEDALADSTLTESELAGIQALKERTIQLVDSEAGKLLEQLNYGASQSQSSSTLSKSIQSITESTADALEAIMNSQRYYSADTNAKVAKLLSILSDTDGAGNPVLAELRAQTTLLQSIYRVLSNNTKDAGHKLGGGGFKTFAAVS